MAREDAALERHVRDLWPDLEHLLEAGESVAQVVSHPGWEAVQTLLQADIDAISGELERFRRPLAQADYAMCHGRIGGLKAALAAVDTIVGCAERRRVDEQARHEAAAESAAER